ncbi:MAG TPA: gamma-glutamyl-gamma-aminobutyrate hydrolase family protein [Puia sp.]|nr:gamma-glutamyl-gamma-aminobutyrate hydrolase family protein [Puia sp.]
MRQHSTMKIGLTYTGSDAKHENYVRWLRGGDPSIEVVRLDGVSGAGDLDALVLSGGVDIAPEFYEGAVAYAHAPKAWQRERDLYEMAALETALDRRLPVLGVCRGLQLINVVLRGDLVQDLGAGDAVHEGAAGVDKRHDVVVEPGTLLHEIAAAGRGQVNSAHHQAVGRLGDGLRVSCRAEDGTIEGLEWAEPERKPFLLAVQWHPERMCADGVGDAAFYAAVRDRFINEIKKRHGNH